MPDSKPVSVPRIAGLVLAALGGVGMIVAALLTWFTVTAKLPDFGIAGMPSEFRAEVTGIGGVTAPAVNGIDVSSNVPVRAAWAGYCVLTLGAVALVAAIVAFARRGLRIPGAALAGIAGLAGGGVAGYALATVPGSQSAQMRGLALDVTTVAEVGPYATIGGGAAAVFGALVLMLLRPAPVALPPLGHRGAQPSVAPAPLPAAPQGWVPPAAPPAQAGPAHAGQPVQSGPPVRRTTPPNPRPAPSNPMPAPAPANDGHLDTVHSPVAQRRPEPEWDRNWPGMLPTPPAPPTPSQQETMVVKRPPRPVRVSPNPETQALPRPQKPQNYDGPTEPL